MAWKDLLFRLVGGARSPEEGGRARLDSSVADDTTRTSLRSGSQPGGAGGDLNSDPSSNNSATVTWMDADGPAPEDSVADTPEFLPQWDQYQLTEVLGQGGMGVVYKAWDASLMRPVAIKMIAAGTQANPEGQGRFRREAAAIARLQHPNIVQILDIGTFQTQPFLALEYVDGGSLANVLNGTPRPAEQAVPLIESVARAMHVAHQAGIIHRDLKPSNILLKRSDDSTEDDSRRGHGSSSSGSSIPTTTFGLPKISDFGLAKFAEGTQGHTISGAFLGTPSYCATEQAAGKSQDVGVRSDVYSLGAILYEMLTGRPPFRGATMMETLAQVAGNEPVAPRMLNAAVPRDLETICLKCLEKSPARRYDSAQELADDLRRWREKQPILAKPVGTWERFVKLVQRQPAMAALILLSNLTLALVVGLIVGLIAYDELAEQRQQVELVNERLVDSNVQLELERNRVRRIQFTSDMGLAERAWQENKIVRMRELLDRQTPDQTGGHDLRGFEWYYLWGLCHQALRTVKTNGRVFDSAVVNDGKLLVFTTDAHTIRFWDLAAWQQSRSLRTERFLQRIATTPDARYVAGATADLIVLYDGPTGAVVFQQQPERHDVRSLAFHPDGKHLISIGYEGRIHVWEVPTGERLQTIDVRPARMSSNVVVSPHGDWLAANVLLDDNGQQELRLWKLDGSEVRRWTITQEPLRSLAVDSQGKRLATGSQDGFISVWDLDRESPTQGFQAHDGPVTSVTFSTVSPLQLASASQDKRAVIWDLDSGRAVYTMKGHTDPLSSVHFIEHDNRVVTAGLDLQVKLWDRQLPAPVRNRDAPTVHTVDAPYAISPSGDFIVRSAEGAVEVWNLESNEMMLRTDREDSMIKDIAIAGSGKRFALLREASVVELWDAARLKLVDRIKLPEGEWLRLALSREGRQLAVAAKHTVQLRDATTGNLQLEIQVPPSQIPTSQIPTSQVPTSQVRRLTFDRQGERIAAAVEPDGVIVWNAHTGDVVRKISTNAGWYLSSMRFSPDGTKLAVDQYHEAQLWDLASGEQVLLFKDHEDGMDAIALSPDGRRIATAAGRGTVRIWDTIDGQLTLLLKSDAGHIFHLQFSNDGQRLICAGTQGVVSWDAVTSEDVADWQQRLAQTPAR